MTASVQPPKLWSPHGARFCTADHVPRVWNINQWKPLTVQPWQGSRWPLYRYVQHRGPTKGQRWKSGQWRKAAKARVEKAPTAPGLGKASQVGEVFKQVPGKLHAGCNTCNYIVVGRKGVCCKEMTHNQFWFWLTKWDFPGGEGSQNQVLRA